MPLSEEEVRIAVRFAFRCDPREIDVRYHRTCPDFDTLRDVFINTDDFRTVNGLARQLGRRPGVKRSIGTISSLKIWARGSGLRRPRGRSLCEGRPGSPEIRYPVAVLNPAIAPRSRRRRPVETS